jgi:pimeloyl-ACP methyl ester carboxylesterase
MGKIVKWGGRVVATLGLLVFLLFLFGAREPVNLTPRFDPASLPTDLDGYLAEQEATVEGLRSETAKQIVWAGPVGQQTEFAIIYLHGFSATSREIRPVPDRVAQALGANLYYTRYAGHGLTGDKLAGPTAQDWMDDTAEALAIGRRLGRKVIVIATSTGGTLAAEAALRPEMMQNVAGIVFVSPNFGIRSMAARLLTWPFARWWVGMVAGDKRCFDPVNDVQAQNWTTCYPTVALLPMAALAADAAARDYEGVSTPALFLFSPQDQVVSPDATRVVAGRWGAAHETHEITVGPGDDPYSHVIAGDALSPGMTKSVTDQILAWAKAL